MLSAERIYVFLHKSISVYLLLDTFVLNLHLGLGTTIYSRLHMTYVPFIIRLSIASGSTLKNIILFRTNLNTFTSVSHRLKSHVYIRLLCVIFYLKPRCIETVVFPNNFKTTSTHSVCFNYLSKNF